MIFRTKLGERGQVVIPKPIRDRLRLDRNSAIEFELQGTTVTLTSARDMRKFDEGIDRWCGSLRQEMLDAGYASSTELMNDIRGR